MKNGAAVAAAIFAAVLVFIVAVAAREVYSLYKLADPNIRLGVMTAIGSAAAFVINNIIQNARERRARLFEAKREAYASFLTFFMSIFHRSETDNPVTEDEMVSAIRSFSTELLTWGSADAIKALNSFARASAQDPTPGVYGLYMRTETFLRALRKDLGHNDASLEKLGLTKLIVRGDEHSLVDNLRPE